MNQYTNFVKQFGNLRQRAIDRLGAGGWRKSASHVQAALMERARGLTARVKGASLRQYLSARWLLPAGGVVLLLALLLGLRMTGVIGTKQPVLANDATARELLADTAAYHPSGAGRHAYLTRLEFKPDQALAACAPGYHMASFWEIYDISLATYDAGHPDAYLSADSGSGAPSGRFGWARTGEDSSGADTAGTGNCTGWTSTRTADHGAAVSLSTEWEGGSGGSAPWEVRSAACSNVGPVWCVANVTTYFFPYIKRK